jgi:hypothetical protein
MTSPASLKVGVRQEILFSTPSFYLLKTQVTNFEIVIKKSHFCSAGSFDTVRCSGGFATGWERCLQFENTGFKYRPADDLSGEWEFSL